VFLSVLDGRILADVRLRVEGAAHGGLAQPGGLRDLGDSADRSAPLNFDLFRILRDNCRPRFQQFGIPTDMPVPLLFGQVEPVKVLGIAPTENGRPLAYAMVGQGGPR